MTVGELIAMDSWIDEIEVIIRKDGWWVHGYRVGKKAELHPVDLTYEVLDARGLDRIHDRHKVIPLKKGEVVDTYRQGAGKKLPMTIICKDVYKAPDKIKNLVVKKFLPRQVKGLHGWSDLGHCLEITCYPPDEVPIIPQETKKKVIQANENQMVLTM